MARRVRGHTKASSQPVALVLAKVGSIRSGWTNVLSALAIVSNDKKPDDNLVSLGHSVVALIMQKHFEPAKIYFVDLVGCLLAYAKCHLVAECLQAMDFLKDCAIALARGEVPIASVLAKMPVEEDTQSDVGNVSYTDSESHLHVWWPLLMGVANLIGDSRLKIRTCAVNTLFGSLKLAGSGFDHNLWELIFKGVLFPVFDDIRVDDASASESEKSWLKNTALVALRALIEMFSFFYDALLFLLPDILALICRCVVQDERKLACVGVKCFTQLINLCSARFSTETWDIVCASLLHIFDMSMPYALLRKDSRLVEEATDRVVKTKRRRDTSPHQRTDVVTRFGAGVLRSSRDDGINVVELPWAVIYTPDDVNTNRTEKNSGKDSLAMALWSSAAAASAARERGRDTLSYMNVVTQCVVQLELLDDIESFIFKLLDHLEAQHVEMIFDCIQRSYNVAAEFDGDIQHRKAVADGGKTLNLSRQETVSSSLLLRAIMYLYRKRPDLNALSRRRFTQLGQQAIDQYCALDTFVTKQGSSTMPETSAEGRLMALLAPVVILILTGLLEMESKHFRSHIRWLYGSLIALMRCNNRDVRTVLGDVFIRQVSGLLDEEVDLPEPQNAVDADILRQRSSEVKPPSPQAPKSRQLPPALPPRSDSQDEDDTEAEANSGDGGGGGGGGAAAAASIDADADTSDVIDNPDSDASANDSDDSSYSEVHGVDGAHGADTGDEAAPNSADAGIEEGSGDILEAVDTGPSDSAPDAVDKDAVSHSPEGEEDQNGGSEAADASDPEGEADVVEGETEVVEVVEGEAGGETEGSDGEADGEAEGQVEADDGVIIEEVRYGVTKDQSLEIHSLLCVCVCVCELVCVVIVVDISWRWFLLGFVKLRCTQ